MKTFVAILGLVVAAGSLSAVGVPPGLAKKNKVPPGFSHGKKKGWQNDYPPGWDQKSEKEKVEWHKAVKKGRDRVSEAAKKRGMSKEDRDAAADEFQKAVRKGLDPDDAESVVKDKIGKGKKGKDLADAVADETEKRLKEKDEKEEKAKGKDKDKDKGRGKGKGKGKKK